jgi:hypothetical protein
LPLACIEHIGGVLSVIFVVGFVPLLLEEILCRELGQPLVEPGIKSMRLYISEKYFT